jgi:hypothetical protein
LYWPRHARSKQKKTATIRNERRGRRKVVRKMMTSAAFLSILIVYLPILP